MAPTRIIVCADDYGLSPGIGRSIRELAAQGCITATGCMVTTQWWLQECVLLRGIDARVDLGLHLTFTDGAPLGRMPRLAPDGRLPSLGKLWRKCLGNTLDIEEIAAEAQRQLDAFEQSVGRPPDYIDGHHHVHQLPVFRDAVLNLFERGRLEPERTALRISHDTSLRTVLRRSAVAKSLAIHALGSVMRGRATALGLRTNNGFTGIYNLREGTDYDLQCTLFLRHLRDGTAFMCHPGMVDDALLAVDRLARQREVEHAYLMGREFLELLDRQGLSLAKFKDLAP